MTDDIPLDLGFGYIFSQGARTTSAHNEGDMGVTLPGEQPAVHRDATVDANTGPPVNMHPLLRDATAQSEPKPGDKMPDGTIYAGISPDTGKPMYTTPADAPLTMTWKAAMKYAAKLDAHGQKDWRVPTEGELNVLFNNRAAIGGFKVTASGPSGWYWSSTEDCYAAWFQRFRDGVQNWNDEYNESSLRCVR